MQPIYPISGRPGFNRVGKVRRVRAIDDPWQDGDGVRSDDDAEELGGAMRYVSPEVVERVKALRADARRRFQAAAPPPEPEPQPAAPRTTVRAPRALPGAAAFSGGNALDAFLVYGDVDTAWRRLRYAG